MRGKKWLVCFMLMTFVVGLLGCSAEEYKFPPGLINSPEVPENPPDYEIPAEFVEHFAAVDAAVAEINASSDFGEYQLLQTDEQSRREADNKSYSDSNQNSFYTRIYPYGSGEYRIVAVSIKAENLNLCGVKVGDSIESAGQVMDQFGFELVYEYTPSRGYKRVYAMYGDYGIFVHLECEGNSNELKTIRIYILDPSDPYRDAIV